MTEPCPSTSVALQHKLAATLKISLGVGIPLAALSLPVGMCTEIVVRKAMTGSADFSSTSLITNLETGLTAAGLSLASDAVVTALVALVGHLYLDKRFYHQKGKTADEMMAFKKANAAIMAYLNGTTSPLGMTLAATQLIGGGVTAEVAKIVFLSQLLSGMITPPIVIGAVALAYYFKGSTARSPDSALAGLESYASWMKAKLNSHGGASPSVLTPGNGMA